VLGIHGPVGEGKTAMCEAVLQKLGVTPFLISGGELESEDAGKPAKLLRETYMEAGKAITENESLMSTVLINDFDTSLGDWGKIVQFTVNTQQIFAELMHLTDYSETVARQETLRIPIILTGNNFQSLHLPLTRTGRMSLFEWIPTSEEKKEIVQKIFPLLSSSQIDEIVSEKFKGKSISFFTHLKSSLFDDQLWKTIEKYGTKNVIHHIRSNRTFEIDSTILKNFNHIVAIGELLEKEMHLADHTNIS
jgi:SpoVK/Ycf46/Vps4 family AAA+-type ATPase